MSYTTGGRDGALPDRIAASGVQEQRTGPRSLRQLLGDAAIAGSADCRMQCHAYDGGENVPMAPHDARSCGRRSPAIHARVPVAHAGRQSQVRDARSTIDAGRRPDQLSSRTDSSARSTWPRERSMRVLRYRKGTVRRLPDAPLDRGSGQYTGAYESRRIRLIQTLAPVFVLESP